MAGGRREGDSYDWIDNLGRTSPRSRTSELENLAVGQRVMTIFRLVAFEKDRHLTMTLGDDRPSSLLGRLAVSYVIEGRDGESPSRLLVKLAGPRVPSALLRWGDLLMMRKQLLTIKHLAETAA